MMNLTVEPGLLLSIITIVAGVTIYSFIRSRHIERMQQLHMGIPLENIHKSFFEIKFGLLFMGVGLGILGAFLMEEMGVKSTDNLYPALSFLFGGLGLLSSFFIVKKHTGKQ